MECKECLICKKNEATQTNSHLIPSFMVAKVCSYDGSGKRDKEVMFTMTTYADKVYVGAVPSTKLDELFDQNMLTDKRIEEELKDNTASKDYIFCPTCEKRLSMYLESPYAEHFSAGKPVNMELAYFFWLSIVWRMSVSGQFQFTLSKEIEQLLGDCLHEYMDAKASGRKTDDIIGKCKFSYQLLRCPSYLPNNMAYIGGKYWKEKGILVLTLGDTILCVRLDGAELPEDFSYLGLEEVIKSTHVNEGINEEELAEIDKDTFEKSMKKMVEDTAQKRLFNEKEIADQAWQKVGLRGMMPDEIFKAFMEKLYSESSKQGDRKTPERYVKIFNETLASFGYKAKG